MAATWSGQSRNTGDWVDQAKFSLDFLLKEDSGFLLGEDNNHILLEQSTGESYTQQSKNTTSYANQSKS